MIKKLLPFLILASSIAFSQMRMIPHVTPLDGAFKTDFILANPTDAALNYTLTPYQSNGTALPTVTGTLAAAETRFYTTSELFPSGGVSHFLLEQDSQLEITAAYQDATGASSPAHVNYSTRQAQRWRIYPSDLDDVIDGLAVVNMDAESRDIHVRQVSESGMEIGRVTVFNLASNSKGLYLFDDFANQQGAFYEVFADGPLALTALRFANASAGGSRYFWETAAITLPPLMENSGSDPRIGQVATFPPNATYGISGRAVIADARTIRLENFSYNGQGPDVRVYVGINENFIEGKIITDTISGTTFNNATIELPLPDDVTLDDFNSISIWCTVFSINFSSGVFQ